MYVHGARISVFTFSPANYDTRQYIREKNVLYLYGFNIETLKKVIFSQFALWNASFGLSVHQVRSPFSFLFALVSYSQIVQNYHDICICIYIYKEVYSEVTSSEVTFICILTLKRLRFPTRGRYV